MRFLTVYCLLAIGDLLSFTVFRDMPWVEAVFKPALMVSLGIWYYVATRTGGRNPFIVAAIAFSLLGDVFLLEPTGFVFGLGAFLVAHISYILAFYRDNVLPVFFQKDRLGWALLITIYGAILLYVLLPNLGELKIPVVIYAVTILTMLLTALNRWKYVRKESFWSVMAGASFFVVSDSLLAVNKFVSPFMGAGVLIMVTYAAGQYLIVTGALKRGGKL